MNVCLAPSHVLTNPSLAGHAWAYLNWTLGFEANGCRVTWLERLNPDTPPSDAVRLLRTLKRGLTQVGLDPPIALVYWPGQRRRYAAVESELDELTVEWEEVASGSELLVNLYYALEPEILGAFRRTVMLDIDPGLLQWWMVQGQLRVAPHDLYLTTGETVGAPGSRIPDGGVSWRYVPPVVHLPAWPPSGPEPDAAYGTVTSWWAEWENIDGEAFSNEKRTSFLPYFDLPAATSVPLELGLCLNDDDPEAAELRRRGWRVFDPRTVCGTPEAYRRYIRSSRGEFSCAKPSCMRLANAWVSDRTLCYLASGKPVVVEHTGPSRFLPSREGMFRFRTPAEAAAALEAVDSDYDRHARAARALAEDHFAAERGAARVLEDAL